MAEHIHWKLNFPSDFLGAQHLPDGKDIIVQIRDIRQEMIAGQNGRTDLKMVIYIDAKDMPEKFICNKTNATRIAKVTGSPYLDEWIGHKIQLYGEMVSTPQGSQMALRVREFAPR